MVKIEGPDGNMVPADVLPIGMDEYCLKFVPRKQGKFPISLFIF